MSKTEKRPLVILTYDKDRSVLLNVVEMYLGDLADIQTIELEHRRMEPDEEDAFVARAKDCTNIFLRPGRLSRRVIERLLHLQSVSIFGAGLNQVDVPACTEKGIYITNAPGGNSEAVAELTFGLLLALMRRIPRADRLVREGRWFEAGYTGNELQDKVMGIVGLGHIGIKVARIARGFNMMPIGFDPYVSAEKFREIGVVPVSLQALMSQADVVCIHAPLTEQNEGMIGAAELGLMKPTAVLVNMARGALVNEAVLYTFLKEGRIAGAALDTFVTEPLPGDSPFLGLENVIVSPHFAGMTHEMKRPVTEMVCQDIVRVLNGERPRNLGNPNVIAVRAKMGLPV